MSSVMCNLTKQEISDPMVTVYGHYYEKNALEEWLERNNVCPITNRPLQRHMCFPDPALKKAIASGKKSASVSNITFSQVGNNKSKSEIKSLCSSGAIDRVETDISSSFAVPLTDSRQIQKEPGIMLPAQHQQLVQQLHQLHQEHNIEHESSARSYANPAESQRKPRKGSWIEGTSKTPQIMSVNNISRSSSPSKSASTHDQRSKLEGANDSKVTITTSTSLTSIASIASSPSSTKFPSRDGIRRANSQDKDMTAVVSNNRSLQTTSSGSSIYPKSNSSPVEQQTTRNSMDSRASARKKTRNRSRSSPPASSTNRTLVEYRKDGRDSDETDPNIAGDEDIFVDEEEISQVSNSTAGGKSRILNLEEELEVIAPRWFYRGGQKWKLYSWVDSDTLEEAYLILLAHPNASTTTSIRKGKVIVNIKERKEINTRDQTERPVLRGLWFMENKSGELIPYPEQLSKKLENYLKKKKFNNPIYSSDKSRGIVIVSPTEAYEFVPEEGQVPVRRVVRGFSSPEERSLALMTNYSSSESELSPSRPRKRAPTVKDEEEDIPSSEPLPTSVLNEISDNPKKTSRSKSKSRLAARAKSKMELLKVIDKKSCCKMWKEKFEEWGITVTPPPFGLPPAKVPSKDDVFIATTELKKLYGQDFGFPTEFIEFITHPELGTGTLGRCRIFGISADSSMGPNDLRLHLYRMRDKFTDAENFKPKHSFPMQDLIVCGQDTKENLWFGWRVGTQGLLSSKIFCFQEDDYADPPRLIAHTFEEFITEVCLGNAMNELGLKRVKEIEGNDHDDEEEEEGDDDDKDEPARVFRLFPGSRTPI